MTAQSKDLREQLTPLAKKLREERSVVRPVSQVILRLKAKDGADRFASTVDEILRWMNRRAGRALPDAAWQRSSFELSEVGAQRVAAVALREPRYWAGRLDDADKTVPMRTWVTEVGVGADGDGDVIFGVRLICTTRGSDAPYERTVPGFLKGVLALGEALLDDQPVLPAPPVLVSDAEVASLVRLLESPNRTSDVIVFSLPERSTDPLDAAASAQSVTDGARGVAHVFVLTGPASYSLTDRVGRELSVFHRGVRTYRPGFRAWVDQPSNHPLFLPHRIAEWGELGPAAFEKWLVNRVLVNSVHVDGREERLPAFNTVRQHAAHAERTQLKASGGSDTELLVMFEEDNERLRGELREQKELYDGLLTEAHVEREAAVQDANAARAQSLERLHRIRLLEKRVVGAQPPVEPLLPATLEGVEEWCQEHLVGSVELANKAFQGLRKSMFHDPQFIYKALLLLRDYYVPMRVEGSSERREAYEQRLKELQLEDSATGEAVKYSADLYSVQYGGSRRALDRHLKGPDSRDRRFGFRLYFFWDDVGQVAVVGWLPSHLDNRAS
jgi:hypothetical protein